MEYRLPDIELGRADDRLRQTFGWGVDTLHNDVVLPACGVASLYTDRDYPPTGAGLVRYLEVVRGLARACRPYGGEMESPWSDTAQPG
jgi:hypothetical protein